MTTYTWRAVPGDWNNPNDWTVNGNTVTTFPPAGQRLKHQVPQAAGGPAPELDDDRLLGRGEDSALRLRPYRRVGSLGAVAPFQDDLTLMRYWLARTRADACAALSSARILGVVRALP
jgi:hypothetical protein